MVPSASKGALQGAFDADSKYRTYLQGGSTIMSSTPPADKPEQQAPGQPADQPPVYQDWREMRYAARDARRAQRAAWREQRRAQRGSWGWGGWGYWGLVLPILLILGGLALLLNVVLPG
jgi:hypothetical protein